VEHRKAVSYFEDLEYLLSPQPWEDTNNYLPKLIGQEFALLRQAKGLTLKEVSQQSGLSLANLGRLEHSSSESGRGVSFRSYSTYAAFLGVTLREVFGLALESELNRNPPAMLKSKIPVSEDELVETAQQAVEELRASGKPLTRKNILESMGVPYQSLSRAAYLQSPGVRKLLRQIGDEIHDDEKWQQERDSDDMLVKVQRAIQQLRDRGECVTYQAVGNIVGVPVRKFRFYPESQVLIKQHASYLHPKTQQARLCEEEIAESVQRAIEQLEASHQRVTGTTVCRTAGISRSCLTTYPCLRAIIDQHADSSCRAQHERAIQRENELLVQIEEAVAKLHSLNQRATQRAIADIVGISQGSLRRYPRVKALLDEKAGMYHHNTRTYSRERANELARQVQTAKEQLESSGRKVTQVAVAEMLGMSAQGLMYYPNVRLMLLQEKTANQTRSAQGSPSEEQLLIELEKVIQQLELQGRSITIPTVSAEVGVTRATIYRYPQCVSSVKKAVENQKRRRFKLREEELLQSVLEAIQRLRELGLPVTFAAVSKAIHTSANSLKYYPRVRSVFEQTAGGPLGAH
jgi:transcriptional regulator with XRE-family HTH domain